MRLQTRVSWELFETHRVYHQVRDGETAKIWVRRMLQTQALTRPGYQENEIDVFEGLVKRYDKGLYNLALRMTGNPEDAKDLAQEALIRAYRSFDSFKLGTSFERWLYRIATNLYIDKLRKKRGFIIQSLDEPITTDEGEVSREIPTWDHNPEIVFASHELMDKIQEGLLALPPEYRAAVILCDVQGLSYEEISNILNCSIGTVRSRIHRGRRILREKLSPYLNSK